MPPPIANATSLCDAPSRSSASGSAPVGKLHANSVTSVANKKQIKRLAIVQSGFLCEYLLCRSAGIVAELLAVEARVFAVSREQYGVRSAFDDAGRFPRRKSRRPPESSRAGARSPSSCVRASAARAPLESPLRCASPARWSPRRESRYCGSFSSTRAIASRWRSPPESLCPRSPTTVSYPSGSEAMKS